MFKRTLQSGVLIAIDGIDGAGKTTQTTILKDYYTEIGFNVSTFKEPTNGFYGRRTKELAANGRHVITPEEELELFINDRIEDCKFNIIPALEAKNIVVVDRYYFSTIAYQGALGLDIDKIIELNENIAVIPNLVFILNIPVKEAMRRIVKIRNDKVNYFEKAPYLSKVDAIFKRMRAPHLHHIDGMKSIDDVFLSIKEIIDRYIDQLSINGKIECGKIEILQN